MKRYKKILSATDFSQNCRLAAERASELARFYGAELVLLHVVDYFPEQRSNDWIEPEGADPKVYQEEQARALLSELANHLGLKEVAQEVVFTNRSAKQEIIRVATEENIDLIVVASHGRHGIGALLGSTASGLANGAPCDVLVVRATNG